MSYRVTVRCAHGVAREAAIDDLGHVLVPQDDCPPRPRPGRLRTWWEARRLRRALDRWRNG